MQILIRIDTSARARMSKLVFNYLLFNPSRDLQISNITALIHLNPDC